MKTIFYTLILNVIFFISTLTISAQNSLSFDGIDDYVSAGGASSLITGSNEMSMSLWVYPENTTAGWPDFDGFAGFRNNTDADFYLMQLGSTDVEARFRNSSGTTFTTSYNGLVLNEWNHFILTYDGSDLTLYHNGLLATSIAANGTISNPGVAFDMGYGFFTMPNNSFYLEGKLDEVAIWDSSFTASTASTIYNSCTLDTNDARLLLYYKFDQGISGGNNTSITQLDDAKNTIHGNFNGLALMNSTSNFVNGVPGNTEGSLTESTCSAYTVPSGKRTYSTSGTFKDTIANANGCDSIMTIFLTINEVNTNVVQSGDTLLAVAGSGSYQWIDCSDFSVITDATKREFIPNASGDYAVIVIDNGCTDTSNCFTVNIITGIQSFQSNSLADIYPNPTTGVVNVKLNKSFEKAHLDVIDVTGKTIHSQALYKKNTALNFDKPKGIYFIRILSDSEVRIIKLIKD